MRARPSAVRIHRRVFIFGERLWHGPPREALAKRRHPVFGASVGERRRNARATGIWRQVHQRVTTCDVASQGPRLERSATPGLVRRIAPRAVDELWDAQRAMLSS